ncbi:hypothetical protein HCN44_000995 [Aphidius gifuensis]|uniref:EF-hand domain-containing protein n=1 Tax=Aphidius gifuensis TaxID=684658 RepID=A0A834XKE7_APHGI|nr:hypothetical protein HCN44_000995 [Aphidius gifuensis]
MKLVWIIGVVFLIMQGCFAPPVTKTKADEEKADHENDDDNNIETEFDLPYQRYLNEVVQALETDPEFRKKLEVAPKEDFSTGKIAHELEFVHHNVRNKLNEIKRIELTRLLHLENELQRKLDSSNPDFKDHVDHTNHDNFDVEDLKKLIHKATADLEEVDKKRREEFKKYEMEKKFEEQLKVQEMDEEQKKKYAEELEHLKQEQKTHKPIHHPGSQKQLEEVWENQDHMGDQEFNPSAFFQIHDLDGNRHWDENEVKILFLKELDKMYAGSKVDVNERAEEMERMREIVFKEADTNRDGFISYSEFLENTKRDVSKQDPEWQPINNQEVYTSEEYEAFQRQREAQIEKMKADGLLIENQYPYQGQVPINGQQYHGQPPQYQGHPNDIQYQQQHPPQYQGQHPPQYQQQHPPQYQQQHPPQHQGQQYQQMPVQHQQVPVQHQQVPVQHQQVPVQHQQVPVQHQQVPVQHQQVPVQHQQVPQHQQIPVQQHPNQVPQHVEQNNINTNQQIPQQVAAQNIPQQQIPVQNNQVPLNTQNINNNLPPQQQQQQNQQPSQSQQHLSDDKSKITSNEIKH